MNSSFDIVTEGLGKTFRDFWCRPRVRAVDALDLNVQQGTIFGLLGPNGSGKSTVMKILLGLLKPTAGHVRVLGASPTCIRVKQRIGYLPEETLLYSHLNADEALRLYGGLFSLPRAEVRSRANELLSMLELGADRKRPIAEDSRGMARRLGLAQALINDPQLLILDEPTAGLDPMGCRQIKDLLKELSTRGKTILLSSHLLADVADVCDHVCILHRGQSLVQGRTRELLEKSNLTQVTVAGLTESQREALRESIAKLSDASPSLKTPSVSLEEFFIHTVSHASAAIPMDVSAGTAPPLAPFLCNTTEK